MKLHSLLSPLVVIGSAIVPIVLMSLPAQSGPNSTKIDLTLSEVITGCGNECAGIKAAWVVRTNEPKPPVNFVVNVQEQSPCIGGDKQCRSETIKVLGLATSAVTRNNFSPSVNGSVVGTFKVTVTGTFRSGTTASVSKIQSFNLP
jgi:hypothetical protein